MMHMCGNDLLHGIKTKYEMFIL